MEQPLLALRPARNPRIGAAVKAAMCVSAALIALAAMLMPELTGIDNIYITGGITSYFSSLYLLPIMAASTVRFGRAARQV